MQNRLRERDYRNCGSARVVDLVDLRMWRGLDALLRAREWLDDEATQSPALSLLAAVSDDLPAQYALALGQVDRALAAAADATFADDAAELVDQLGQLRGSLSMVLEDCEKKARASCHDPARRAQRWAHQRIQEELGPLLREALR